MSSNAEFESLVCELRALRDNTREDREALSQTMLVMRLVRGFSRQRWQEFCRHFPLSQWCALPLPDVMPAAQMADLRSDVQSPLPLMAPPAALVGALNQELFTAQLERELLRLERHGGFLSLLCTAVTPPPDPASRNLEQPLADSLRHCLEICDSMGCLGHDCYAALLPGIGQVRVRRLAQQLQKLFAMRLQKMTRIVQDGDLPCCAVGLLCVDRYTADSAAALLDRARAALTTAQLQPVGHIHQEGHDAMNERVTQVQSDEKRFLFFGGGQ